MSTQRYAIFVIDNQTHSAGGDEMAAIDAFNDGLRAGGHWIYAAGIAEPAHAKLIDGREGRAQIAAGSLFASEEFYSGFWLISAESLEQAEGLALAGSRACNRRVELRPFL